MRGNDVMGFGNDDLGVSETALYLKCQHGLISTTLKRPGGCNRRVFRLSLRGAQPLMVSLSNHVAISLRLSTCRGTIIATATRLPPPYQVRGRNDMRKTERPWMQPEPLPLTPRRGKLFHHSEPAQFRTGASLPTGASRQPPRGQHDSAASPRGSEPHRFCTH